MPDKDPRLSMGRRLFEHAKNYNNSGDCGARFKNGCWIGGFERFDTPREGSGLGGMDRSLRLGIGQEAVCSRWGLIWGVSL
ncbi:hypothetical protein TRIP_B200140 [uncultured Desulfatiglans sp.]|uniref:Uncharacterized protein n=1 Tax=Uncultured Desulfatiglans sp. TaxID=1748965 RepID=A0A653A1U3_UNCDX|nr:hypothetical protein TRIP_B200140 [uncultured Desulfatiglans sp.]